MKKHSKKRSQSPKGSFQKRAPGWMTIGMDLGDKTSRYCLLDGAGELVKEGSVATTRKAVWGTR